MIETLNEHSLHSKLKSIFCPFDGKIEVPIGSFTCDIVCSNGKIIEIQTGNFHNIVKKLNTLLKDYIIEIIYPISVNSYIKTLDAENKTLRCKMSPLHGCIFQVCKEMSCIKHLSHNKNLKIRLVYIESLVTKIDDKKGRGRYKNPRIIEKELIKIINEEYYNSLIELFLEITKKLPDPFTSNEIKSKGYKKRYGYVISLLKYLELIEESGKIGNRKIYKKRLMKHIHKPKYIL